MSLHPLPAIIVPCMIFCLPLNAAEAPKQDGNTTPHIRQVLRRERVSSVIEETGKKLGINVQRMDATGFNDLEGSAVDHCGFTGLAKLTIREDLLGRYVLALTQDIALAIKKMDGEGPMIDSYTDPKRRDWKPMLSSRIQYTRGDVRGLICIFGIQTSKSEGTLAITCYEHRDSQKDLPNPKEEQSEPAEQPATGKTPEPPQSPH